jgi:hypothetical protein
MSEPLGQFRKHFLQARNWEQRKDGAPLYLFDSLSPSDREVAEEEMIAALSLNDDWPVQGLAHIRSRKALPRLKELLGKSNGKMKIVLAQAIFRISGDPAMPVQVLAALPGIRNTSELIDVLYLLPGFGDEKINGYLQSLLEHPEYLVAYNAARVMGLSTDDVVQKFRNRKPAAQTPTFRVPPVKDGARNPFNIFSLIRLAATNRVPAYHPEDSNKRTLGWRWRLASMLLFGISLALPAYCTGTTCSHSLLVFLLGGFGLLGGHGWSWLANPLLFVAWSTLRRSPRLSMILSTMAFIFAGLFMLGGSVPVNENGGVQSVTSLKAGYWCWLLSNGVMMLGAMSKVYRLNLVWREERLARGEVSKFN